MIDHCVCSAKVIEIKMADEDLIDYDETDEATEIVTEKGTKE
jgi:hypothetical protein